MARKQSSFHGFLMLVLFALATYGGWVLYGKYENDIESVTNKVKKNLKASKTIWRE